MDFIWIQTTNVQNVPNHVQLVRVEAHHLIVIQTVVHHIIITNHHDVQSAVIHVLIVLHTMFAQAVQMDSI